MVWLIAATVVVIIFILSRKAGFVACGLLACVYVGLWFAEDRLDGELPSNRSVSIVAKIDPQLCPTPGEPVAVTFTNSANQALVEVSFSLTAREAGHSSTIYRAYLKSDRIVASGDSQSVCYGINQVSFLDRSKQFDVNLLEWSGEVSLARFAGR